MLSVTVQHAFKALSMLAGLPEGSYILGRDLAKQSNIPANYLAKILWTLGGAGFIDATRGSGGGYRLQRAPETIRLVEIVDLFERHRNNRTCILDAAKTCTDVETCPAHRAWRQVTEAMDHFLETTTLADFAAHHVSDDRGSSI
ncbi:MAG: Rrf2 family transcriptional regulator [Bryobacterales bacterium]|nr:Rrf2 family transcriptional regulator [Bryobacterales bacterium]